ncbi:ABC transporter ATP-binding protein [Nocardioides sp. Soil797]|nr:ABC transporter ATP-binding protein [Nocardioides sp. Soil797]
MVEGVCVVHGDVTALRSVDLTLTPGSFTAVHGPSGSGKSTLLWALAAATRLSNGTVTLGGVALTDRDRAARLGVALIPQGNGLVGTLTANENLFVAATSSGLSPGEAAERSDEALRALGLEDVGEHLIEELSGGQQQRVAIARALASRPSVLLADEPTSELDSATRERVIAALRRESDRGAIVVMTTNDPVAAQQADVVLTIHEGTLAHEM